MFRDFITKLSQLTYYNIEEMSCNKTFGIPSSQYLDLLHDLQWNFTPEMSSGTPITMYIIETITELGICHSVNSLIARYYSYEYNFTFVIILILIMNNFHMQLLEK